jgi:hypothetical protein
LLIVLEPGKFNIMVANLARDIQWQKIRGKTARKGPKAHSGKHTL